MHQNRVTELLFRRAWEDGGMTVLRHSVMECAYMWMLNRVSTPGVKKCGQPSICVNVEFVTELELCMFENGSIA